MKKIRLILASLVIFAGCASEKGFGGGSGSITDLSPLTIESPNVTANDNGVYFTDHQVLYFYDIKSGESAPVCSNPGCTHSDSSCTAYMPDVSTSLFCDNNEVLWFTENGEIYKMNADGSERKNYYYPMDGAYIVKKFVSDNDNIYFVEGRVDVNGNVKYYIMYVGKEAPYKCNPLYSTDKCIDIMGAYSDKIVLSCQDESGTSIIAFYPKSGEVETLVEDAHNTFVTDGKRFTVADDYNSVTCRDLPDGETISVCDRIGVDKEVRNMLAEYCFDSYILYHLTGAGEYIVNTNDGSSTKLDLHITAEYMESVPKDYVDPTLISVLDRIGDKLVVYIGDKETTYMGTNPAGQAEEMSTIEGVLALISIDDFLSNNPNYTVLNAPY